MFTMTLLKRNSKYNRGFTLIEVLVSAAILVVAVAATAVIISRGSKLNREDMLRRRAYQVMEEVVGRHDLHYKMYPVLLTLFPSVDDKVLVENPEEIVLFDVKGENIKASVQRRLEKKLLTFSGTQVPCIEVEVTLTSNAIAEALTLSTLVTSTPP